MTEIKERKLEPVPNQQELIVGTGKPMSHLWTQWFTNLREKVNVISTSLVQIATNNSAGFLSSDGSGGVNARKLVGGGSVSITNPEGILGDPVITVPTVTVPVTSVFGRTGNVTGATGDYNLDEVVDSTTRFAAIQAGADKTLLNKAFSINTPDTRSINDLPGVYQLKGPGVYPEFKFRSVIGAPGGATYGMLETKVQWHDDSGGPVNQIFYTSDGVYRRTGTNAAGWTAWYMGFDKQNKPDLATTDVLNKTAANITYSTGGTVDSLKPAVAGSTKNLVPAQYPAENLFSDPGATNLELWSSTGWTLDGVGGMVSPAAAAAPTYPAVNPLDEVGSMLIIKTKPGIPFTIGLTASNQVGTGLGYIRVLCYDVTGLIVTGGNLQTLRIGSGSGKKTYVVPAGTDYLVLALVCYAAVAGDQITISDFFCRIGSQTSHDPGGQKSYVDFSDNTLNGHLGKNLGNIPSLPYTAATLPIGVLGTRAHITDAVNPTFLAVVSGGGSIVAPVFFNGTNWIYS